MFRVVVQDSRLTPTSGKIVVQLGSYDPHTKAVILDKEKASLYLSNGAQPSERVVRLLKSEGVKLPSWVIVNDDKAGKLRHPEKLRKNQPVQEATPETEPVQETVTEAEATPAPAEPAVPAETVDAPSEEEPVATEEAPAEEPAVEPETSVEAPVDAPASEQE